MKLNWGTGILITIILFLIVSFGMIFHFMNQKVDLVTDNYYEKTLVYQTQIDEAERSRGMNKEIELEYINNQLKIVLPDSSTKHVTNGEIYFYRPSDSKMDFKSAFKLNENGEFLLETAKIEKGYWKVYLKWIMNGKSYSIERTLMIN